MDRELRDDRRAQGDDAPDEVGPPRRQRLGEHAAAALADDHDAVARRLGEPLEPLLEPGAGGFAAGDVRADARPPRVPAGAAEPARHRRQRPVAGQETGDQQHAPAVARGHADAPEDVRSLQAGPLEPDAALTPDRRDDRNRRARNAHDQQVLPDCRCISQALGAFLHEWTRRSRRDAVGEPLCKHRPMRAATIRDGVIAVAEHPDPEPESGELLVAVRAAGLNGADMIQLAGRYPAPAGAPQDIPGLEMAGEVVGRRTRGVALRARRPGHGRRRGRRAGRARRGPRAGGDARARGARLDGRGRRPGGVHDRARRALHPGRRSASGSACWCTAPRAASGWRPCSSGRWPARA